LRFVNAASNLHLTLKMPLTVLSDTDVKNLLRNLTLHDVEKFQASLRLALHEYSTGTQDNDACATHQPERTSVKSANGTTTLFMPSTNTSGIGMKGIQNDLPLYSIPSLTHEQSLLLSHPRRQKLQLHPRKTHLQRAHSPLCPVLVIPSDSSTPKKLPHSELPLLLRFCLFVVTMSKL
jgi:hypothetical protein